MLRKLVKKITIVIITSVWQGSNYLETRGNFIFYTQKLVKMKDRDQNQCWQGSEYLGKREFSCFASGSVIWRTVLQQLLKLKMCIFKNSLVGVCPGYIILCAQEDTYKDVFADGNNKKLEKKTQIFL